VKPCIGGAIERRAGRLDLAGRREHERAHAARYHRRNFAHGFVLLRRDGGVARLDDVDSEVGQREGDVDLVVERKRTASQRGIENEQSIGHGADSLLACRFGRRRSHASPRRRSSAGEVIRRES
jgi:hypothetical protein